MSDLIYKEDAIDTVRELNRKVNDGRENDTICTSDVFRRINALPSADRTEPGRWEIKQDTDEYGLKRPKLVCSKCGKEPAAWDLTELFEFCPNCGAEMVREERKDD